MMCARPWTGTSEAQQLEDGAHVDRRRLEQRVGHGRPAQLGRPVVEAEAAVGQQRPAGEGVAVGVQAAWTGRRRARRPPRSPSPVTIASSATVPNAAPHRSKPRGRRVAADQLGEHGELAARDLDAGRLRADAQALGDAPEPLGVGLLDGEVVEHRDRLGADADEVVDVHRDAVDPDGLEAVGLLGDDELGADAVGRERDAELVGDPQDARVVARRAAPTATAGPSSIRPSRATIAATAASDCPRSTPAAA